MKGLEKRRANLDWGTPLCIDHTVIPALQPNNQSIVATRDEEYTFETLAEEKDKHQKYAYETIFKIYADVSGLSILVAQVDSEVTRLQPGHEGNGFLQDGESRIYDSPSDKLSMTNVARNHHDTQAEHVQRHVHDFETGFGRRRHICTDEYDALGHGHTEPSVLGSTHNTLGKGYADACKPKSTAQ